MRTYSLKSFCVDPSPALGKELKFKLRSPYCQPFFSTYKWKVFLYNDYVDNIQALWKPSILPITFNLLPLVETNRHTNRITFQLQISEFRTPNILIIFQKHQYSRLTVNNISSKANNNQQLMLQIYLEGKQSEWIDHKQLPTETTDLQKCLLERFPGGNYQTVELYDIAGQQVVGGQTDPSWLTYAVVARNTEEAVKWRPIRVTLRRTDKTGHVLFKHPSTTLKELQVAIQQLTNVAVVDQELLHKGYHLADLSATIEQIGLRQSSIIHLIDLHQQPKSNNQVFLLNVQTAQSFSQTYQIEVAEGYSVLQLKEKVSPVLQIPIENLLITYCGMILAHDETNLRDYKLVPGAYINAINEKKTFKISSEAKHVEVHLRETTRVVPTTAQHEILTLTSNSATVTTQPTKHA